MKKILFILIAVSGILPLASRAAVINGVLVDSQDTTELIEASVRLLMANKDSTMVKGTTTDMNGVTKQYSYDDNGNPYRTTIGGNVVT